MAEYDVKELDITKGGNTYKIKGETYESKSAASGGTDVSLVTTGEKYTWNNKASSDTKNTAGTTNKTGTKMFIAAATEQSANPTTYSNANVYIGTDNCLYSGGTKVLTAHQDISGKKNTQSAVSDPSASGTSLTFISSISQNAQGVISPTKKTVSTMGGASSSAAGSAGLVPAPSAGDQNSYLKGDGTWGTGALTPSSAIAIPASGVSVSKDMPGITADYVLVAWRFSSSAENAPPASLSWATYSGYFTITNNGGATSESIQPVFSLPTAVAVTNHT